MNYVYLRIVLRVGDELGVLEEDLRHAVHGLVAPLVIPVDGAAVDEGGVHATALPEQATGGAHGEHDVQLAVHALQEELVDGHARVGHLGLRRRPLQVDGDAVQLLVVEQVGHFARVQDAVDVLEEALLEM